MFFKKPDICTCVFYFKYISEQIIDILDNILKLIKFGIILNGKL